LSEATVIPNPSATRADKAQSLDAVMLIVSRQWKPLTLGSHPSKEFQEAVNAMRKHSPA
jgi:hypothetical protein